MDFTKYFKMHAPGYVIDFFYKGKTSEFLYGNRCYIEDKIPVTSDTLYDIASLTKMFTAVLVYMAYEEGKLNIYDTVYNIDNNFINLKDVKIIDLLSHNQEIWTDGYLGDAVSKDDFYRILYTAYIKNPKPIYVDTHYIILYYLLYLRRFMKKIIQTFVKRKYLIN